MKNSIFVLNNVNIILVNTMKKTLFLLPFFCLLCAVSTLCAADTLFIKETRIPILIERQDNVLFYLRLDAKESQTLNDVVLNLGEGVNLSEIQSIKLYYGGTEALQDSGKKRFAPVGYISSNTPGKTLAANPSYSIKKSEVTNPGNQVVLKGDQKLFPGINYFWISLQMKPGTSLTSKVTADMGSISLDGKIALLDVVSENGIDHRMGVEVRHAGDDNSATYRIPGLVTTN